MAHSARPTLRLVREQKLSALIPPVRGGSVLEASGVCAKGPDYYVVFDNVRRVARLDRDLDPESGRHEWLGRTRPGEGYEDIAYSPHKRRFYLLVEAAKHPDGTYKGQIDECDERGQIGGRSWIDFDFPKRNRGFEGLSVVRWKDREYLLALCEGNRCRCGARGRKAGGGRIQILRKRGRMWKPVGTIKLPRKVAFEDYSAVALRGSRIAVLSQQDSRLWIGTLRPGAWTITGAGKIYDLPRSKKGKRRYCTPEGVAWLSDATFVIVSDLCKRGYPRRCSKTDQSIHVFSLSKGRART